MKHKEGKNEYPSLVSDLRGSDFSFSAVSIMLALAFSHTAFNMLRKVPSMGSPGGSVVKGLPAVQEMQVQSLHQEDPLEEEMAIHSSILAYKIPWAEESGGLESTGL